MAYLEFSLTDKRFFNAQEGWRQDGKSEPEISIMTSALLKQVADDKESGARDAAARGESLQMGKFPKWLRTFLNEQVNSVAKGSKLKWDPENDTYSVRLPLDVMEINDWLTDTFEPAYIELLATDEAKDFSDNFQLRPTMRDTDGQAEMADLEGHFRGAQPSPSRTNSGKKSKHEEDLPE